MKKKIALIGTHGSGKTTYSYQLANEYKLQGKSVKIVQEVARSCPFPLNEKMSKEACLWIYLEHARKELEALKNHDVVICDRSVIDSFIYALSMNCYEKDLDLYFQSAEEGMKSYEQIIYIEPSGVNPFADGFRSTDLNFQEKVRQQMINWLNNSGLDYKVKLSSEIFNREKSQ